MYDFDIAFRILLSHPAAANDPHAIAGIALSGDDDAVADDETIGQVPLLVQADQLLRSGALTALSAPARLRAFDFNALADEAALPPRWEELVEVRPSPEVPEVAVVHRGERGGNALDHSSVFFLGGFRKGGNFPSP